MGYNINYAYKKFIALNILTGKNKNKLSILFKKTEKA